MVARSSAMVNSCTLCLTGGDNQAPENLKPLTISMLHHLITQEVEALV